MKYLHLLSLISILMLSSGCVEKQPTTSSTSSSTLPSIILSADDSTTNYPSDVLFDARQLYSSSLGGAYANNNTLHQFINEMINKYHFNRSYLYGVFSSVTRDTQALQKYNVYKTGKPIAKATQPGDWDKYRAQFLTDARISKGVEFWKENRYYLEKAAHQYGVAPEYIVGIIGVETNFGRYTGTHSVLNALTTLSIEFRDRQKFFTNQLENYLLLTADQKLDPRAIKGSYAGAFGLAQFMPDSFRDYAVDHDGNGQINIFTKADAIGSVANFFVKKGKWNPQIPVAIPVNYSKARFSGLLTGRTTSYSQSHLSGLGMRPAANFYGYTGNVALISLNRYNRDELWWGTPNFVAITKYNPQEYYAMAVHQLAQAVRFSYYQQSR
ncbi:MAG: lytic murein transglycosylase B [Campylobacterales bacterium]|nr:lytic murein transglycosylase B [Campylobacterales bacterium]